MSSIVQNPCVGRTPAARMPKSVTRESSGTSRSSSISSDSSGSGGNIRSLLSMSESVHANLSSFFPEQALEKEETRQRSHQLEEIKRLKEVHAAAQLKNLEDFLKINRISLRDSLAHTTGMIYRNLGKSGLRVSCVGLGTWVTFGGQITDEVAEEMTTLAYESGINLFDTSEVYNCGRYSVISMQTPHSSFLTFMLLLVQLSVASGGKILVFPLDGSHWVNMKVIIEELHGRGHEITVLRPSDSWYIKEESPLYTSVTLPCRGGFEENFGVYLSQQLEIRLQIKPGSFWSNIWTHMQLRSVLLDQFSQFHKKVGDLMIHMFENEDLMQSLEAAKYDLVLTDPGIGGGAMLARKLQLPLVFNVRWTIQGEAHFLIAPSPLSYVPFTATELTDKMTFPQRLKNFLSYFVGMLTLSYVTEPAYKPIVKRFFGPDVDYSTFFLDADIWLMRSDFVFEFPRPTVPNVVYMGGFQCKPSKSLPADLEEFVQSSRDHGIVVMTLGTLVSNLPQVVSEEIAAAFAQLPQKVIWRYVGQKPNNLGNNTLLVKWLPQNNLLGHPKTRVFITHGGTNGVQEAIYHGVPVIGLPLFFDQPDNLCRVKAKGAAVTVDIAMLDRHIFKEALMTVIYNSTYRDNMRTLSKLHRDQPVKPLDQAVFWIEYVMRHKGARHLQTRAHKLSWFIYNSVDVFTALLAAVLLVTIILIAVVRLLWRKIFTRRKIKQQ